MPNQPSRISAKGLDLLKKHEGVRQVVYKDAAGYLTVGVGHLVKPGENYKLGQKISMAEVDSLLLKDLQSTYSSIRKLVKVALSQNQFDSLCSLIFNIGEGAFSKSTVLRELNKGNYSTAGNGFSLFVRAKGKILKGLVTRRESEKSHFLSVTDLIESNPKTSAGIGVGVGIAMIAILYLITE